MCWDVRAETTPSSLRCCRLSGKFEDYRESRRARALELKLEGIGRYIEGISVDFLCLALLYPCRRQLSSARSCRSELEAKTGTYDFCQSAIWRASQRILVTDGLGASVTE